MPALLVLVAAAVLLLVRGFWRLATVPLFKIVSETQLGELSVRVELERRTSWPLCIVVREVWISRKHPSREYPFWVRSDGTQMSDLSDSRLWSLIQVRRLEHEHQQPETESA